VNSADYVTSRNVKRVKLADYATVHIITTSSARSKQR
jgi:hypothetical protein